MVLSGGGEVSSNKGASDWSVDLFHHFRDSKNETSFASMFGVSTAEKPCLTGQLVKLLEMHVHTFLWRALRSQGGWYSPKEAGIEKEPEYHPLEPLAPASLASLQFWSSSSWAAARAPAPCLVEHCAMALSPFPKWVKQQELRSAHGKQHWTLLGQWAS